MMTANRLICTILACHAFAGVACRGGGASPDDGSGKSDSGLPVCRAPIGEAVLDAAVDINETAEIVDRRTVYGIANRSFGDVVIVRVSDDTEPSDYVAITSRLDDGVVVDSVCAVPFIDMVATGFVADELADISQRLPTSACQTIVMQAVLAKALEVNDTADVTGLIPLYGGPDSSGSVLIAQVSDDTEPSEYAVVTDGRSAGCRVVYAEMIASGDSGMLSEAPSFARHCTLTELRDSTVFEESLSVDEWPDISIERSASGVLEFTIGASLFIDGEDGYALSLETGLQGFLAARIVHDEISYGVDAIETEGMITVTEPGQLTKIVGDLNCPL